MMGGRPEPPGRPLVARTYPEEESVVGKTGRVVRGSDSEVSGAKGLVVILGAMFGFMALLAIIATVVSP